MYPVLFSLGPIEIHAYGFMVAIAFLVGIYISIRYARKVGIGAEVILDLAIWVIIAAIVGSRLLYVVGRWNDFKGNLLDIVMVQKGGLAFLGGFLLALLVVYIFSLRKKIPILRLFDVLAPGLSIGYAIARVGCFLNGCCFGVPTRWPWGLIFPPDALAYLTFPHVHIHPTQLYSLFSMLIVFGLIVYLWKNRKYDGQIFFIWLILYAVYRFTVEFFRFCPPELYVLGLDPGQVIALGMFLAGVIGLVVMGRANA